MFPYPTLNPTPLLPAKSFVMFRILARYKRPKVLQKMSKAIMPRIYHNEKINNIQQQTVFLLSSHSIHQRKTDQLINKNSEKLIS